MKEEIKKKEVMKKKTTEAHTNQKIKSISKPNQPYCKQYHQAQKVIHLTETGSELESSRADGVVKLFRNPDQFFSLFLEFQRCQKRE